MNPGCLCILPLKILICALGLQLGYQAYNQAPQPGPLVCAMVHESSYSRDGQIKDVIHEDLCGYADAFGFGTSTTIPYNSLSYHVRKLCLPVADQPRHSRGWWSDMDHYHIKATTLKCIFLDPIKDK